MGIRRNGVVEPINIRQKQFFKSFSNNFQACFPCIQINFFNSKFGILFWHTAFSILVQNETRDEGTENRQVIQYRSRLVEIWSSRTVTIQFEVKMWVVFMRQENSKGEKLSRPKQ